MARGGAGREPAFAVSYGLCFFFFLVQAGQGTLFDGIYLVDFFLGDAFYSLAHELSTVQQDGLFGEKAFGRGKVGKIYF